MEVLEWEILVCHSCNFKLTGTEFHILHRKIVGTSYRIVNKRDVVPRVPTHIFEISGKFHYILFFTDPCRLFILACQH